MEQLIEILIRLLLLLFMGTSSSFVAPDAGQGGGMAADTFQSYTIIESVDVVVMESFPMQVALTVKGAQPDGCELPVTVEQRREGNTVTVEIYREMSIAMICAAVLVPYEDTIQLEGGFDSGSYTFHINDFVIERDL